MNRATPAGTAPTRTTTDLVPHGHHAGRLAADQHTAAGPPVRRAVAAAYALLRRDAAQQRLVRLPLVLDLTFGVLNLLIFLFISHAFSQPAAGFAGGTSYFDFAAVGIVFMLMVQTASSQAAGRVRDERAAGTLEMVVAQPVAVPALAIGLVGHAFLLALLRAGVYLAILSGLLGMSVDAAHWPGVAVTLVVGAVAMLPIGVGAVALAVLTRHGDTVVRLLLVGLAFTSGTYFPVPALPPGLREAATALPSRLAIDALRTATAGGDWVDAALALLGSTVALLPLAIGLFAAALAVARRRGTLTDA